MKEDYTEGITSEALMRSIFRAAPVGIGVVLNRVFLDVNERFCEITGYAREEVIGQSARMIYPTDEDYEYVGRVKYQQISNRGTGTVETRFLRKDGEIIDVLLSSTPLDPEDLSAGVTFTALDITERVQAEEARERLTAQVQAQARELQQILATVPAGVLLLDASGLVRLANPMAEASLAILAQAGVGDVLSRLGDRPLVELLASPPTKGLWHEVKGSGRTFEVIARAMGPGTQSIPNASQQGNGYQENWVLVINEVTQEREIRARLHQQERLASLGQLAAGIAHDFNNIMGSIVLYSEMAAQSQELPPRDRERMAVINQQAWHATRLITQILDFSRRAVLERRPLDLLPLLKEQVKLLRRTLPEHITVELAVPSPPSRIANPAYIVNADPTRIQQMLTNLAVNARDAMPEGGRLCIGLERVTITPEATLPPLQVSPSASLAAGAWIQLTVADTGTGIAPDVLPYIYEPFFTTKGPGEGSGLGLAQVHGIVGQHGGHIDVKTQVGEGTTFTVYFPSEDATLDKPRALPPTAAPSGQGEVILLVEDEAILRQAMKEILETLNYQVLEAADGQEALAVAEAQGEGIALVLSDLVMPGMGGAALFHALRERGRQMPVILITGHPMDKELKALQAQGVAAWLQKPPDLEQLAQAVGTALHKG